MSLQAQLAAASTRETVHRDSEDHAYRTGDCAPLAHEEGLPQPFRVKFKDQSRLHSRRGDVDQGAGGGA